MTRLCSCGQPANITHACPTLGWRCSLCGQPDSTGHVCEPPSGPVIVLDDGRLFPVGSPVRVVDPNRRGGSW